MAKYDKPERRWREGGLKISHTFPADPVPHKDLTAPQRAITEAESGLPLQEQDIVSWTPLEDQVILDVKVLPSLINTQEAPQGAPSPENV